jgi:hypothetical protein
VKIVTMTTRKNGQVQQERSPQIRRSHRQVPQQQERSTKIRRSHIDLCLLSLSFVVLLVCHFCCLSPD